mmetsp:Transcript_94695/g.268068  ORF Transcript_94695/g.268068 Transcript_94695/m.268068 type:complete len:241 (+) Transcript_94695:482-1204(+)
MQYSLELIAISISSLGLHPGFPGRHLLLVAQRARAVADDPQLAKGGPERALLLRLLGPRGQGVHAHGPEGLDGGLLQHRQLRYQLVVVRLLLDQLHLELGRPRGRAGLGLHELEPPGELLLARLAPGSLLLLQAPAHGRGGVQVLVLRRLELGDAPEQPGVRRRRGLVPGELLLEAAPVGFLGPHALVGVLRQLSQGSISLPIFPHQLRLEAGHHGGLRQYVLGEPRQLGLQLEQPHVVG